MSNQCSQCGSSIPDGQIICSMCMGDINHGSDGYYQEWAEEQMAEEQARHDAMMAEQMAAAQAEAEAAAAQAANEQGCYGQ